MKEVFIELPNCTKRRMRNSSMILSTIILVLLAIGFIFGQAFCILSASVLLAVGFLVNADFREVFHV